MSVCVRQHTQDVRGCPCVSVCVRLCPSAHTGRPWLSISTHISTLVLGLSTLALPVYCLGDFGPRGLSVQYTGHPWVSASTHMTSVAFCGCPSAHTGRLWLSVCIRVCLWVSASIHRIFAAVRGCLSAQTGCPCVSVSTHKTSVCVCQHTQDVRVCLSAHTGRPWMSISTHISTLVLGLSTLALPVDGSGNFGPRVLSVQYTQDGRGCPSAHTGRPWVFVKTHRTFVAVSVCPCVSVRTHMTSVAVHQYTYQHVGRWTQHANPSRGLFGSQHTQDVCGCPSAHTGRPGLSMSVRVCPCVSVSTHRTSVAVHQYTYKHVGPRTQHADPSRGQFGSHISTLDLGLRTLALPVDCLGDFGPRGLSVQYTQDVRGCPPAHTRRLWLSVSTHKTSVAVRVCPCVSVGVRQHTQDVRGCQWLSVSTHRTSMCVRQHTQDVRVCLCVSVSTHGTSVAVHQYTYQHAGPWIQHADPSRGLFGTHRTSGAVRVCPLAHTGRLWLSVCVRVCLCVSVSTHRILSISTHISMLVLGLSTLDCSGDFGPRGLSGQYTQDVRGCPSAHTGRPWLSVCVRVCSSVSVNTHRTSVPIHQYTYQHVGPWTQHAGPSHGLFGTHRTSVAVCVCPCVSVGVRQHTQDVRGCMWLSVSTNRTSVCVRQHTQDVRVCLSAHTGRLWLSISTHISTLVLGLSTLALPVDGSGDFGPRGLSVQYTLDGRGCPSAHTGRPWVFVSTHRTSVAVLHTGRPWVSVSSQHTQDICGCPSAHTGRPCVSVSTHRTSGAVRVCPCVSSAHTGCPWLSISTHISTLVLGLCTLTLPVDCSGDFGPRGLSAHTGHPCLSINSHISTLVLGLRTLALPVDCLGDFGPRGLSFQYTQDVRGCPPTHTEHLWLSVAVRQHTQDVRGCPCVLCGVRQHTQDVCGCQWLSVSTHRTSMCVRQHTQDVCVRCVCPSVHIVISARWPFPWTVWVILAHVGCLFSTHMTSVGVRQHTQDVRVCPSAHTGRLWLPCVSVCVRQHTYQHIGPWIQHADPSRGLFGTSVAVCVCPSVHQYLDQHVGTWTQHASPSRGLFGSFWPTWAVCSVHTRTSWVSASTQRTFVAVRDCPSAHTGRPWLSVCVVCVCGCPPAYTGLHTGRPWVFVSTHRMSVGVRQHTQDICGCPSAHTGRLCMSVCVHQHTQDVSGCPLVHISARWSLGSTRWPFPGTVWVILAHVGCLFSTHRTSVGVRQYTQDVRGCLWLSVSTHRTSVTVRVCPSAHTGRPWVSVSTDRTSVCVRQHTQDVCGCPCVSVCVRQHTQDVRGCPSVYISALHRGRPWVSASTHRTSVAVHGCPSAHTGHPWLSVCVRVCPSGHTGRPWLSISTHISTLVLGLSTLTLPVDCSGDFGPRGLFVQYTQDVRGCSPAHTGRLWLSVSTHRTSVAVRVCPCVSVSTHRTSVAVHQYTYQPIGPWTQHSSLLESNLAEEAKLKTKSQSVPTEFLVWNLEWLGDSDVGLL
ncbi:hypothetical protein IGI04_042684 [Brassica rapa subsp. trilocularis]|uniref:Uncharacterized protein n=1 Tax=Brassica rapa subsp. trilocularis TaxID=1813537 RepID=A0ABQ7KIT4_BRACM|nr:hypothetical protein IGI04_042684 [Brassica rapa subsp. trilocularis]